MTTDAALTLASRRSFLQFLASNREAPDRFRRGADAIVIGRPYRVTANSDHESRIFTIALPRVGV